MRFIYRRRKAGLYMDAFARCSTDCSESELALRQQYCRVRCHIGRHSWRSAACRTPSSETTYSPRLLHLDWVADATDRYRHRRSTHTSCRHAGASLRIPYRVVMYGRAARKVDSEYSRLHGGWPECHTAGACQAGTDILYTVTAASSPWRAVCPLS